LDLDGSARAAPSTVAVMVARPTAWARTFPLPFNADDPRVRRRHAIRSEPVHRPAAGVERFDGEPLLITDAHRQRRGRQA
jgi:hypothetical protein